VTQQSESAELSHIAIDATSALDRIADAQRCTGSGI
jgi:hypothetical protein